MVQDESIASVLVALAVAVVLFVYGYLTMRGLARTAAADQAGPKRIAR